MTKSKTVRAAKNARFSTPYQHPYKKPLSKTETLDASVQKFDKPRSLSDELQEFDAVTRKVRIVGDHAQQMWNRGPCTVKMLTGFLLNSHDLTTLRDQCWVNDEIINSYFDLLCKLRPGVFNFSTYFYSIFVQKGYNHVKRWTEHLDIFSCDIVLVPIHLGNHWTLCSVDFQTKTISYFDSLGGGTEPAEQILVFLTIEHYYRKNDILGKGWKILSPPTPQQLNSFDCGVFVCQFAKQIVDGKQPTSVSPHLMSFFRRQMVCELTSSQIFTNP